MKWRLDVAALLRILNFHARYVQIEKPVLRMNDELPDGGRFVSRIWPIVDTGGSGTFRATTILSCVAVKPVVALNAKKLKKLMKILNFLGGGVK